MTFEQQVVEKIQELAKDYELRLLEFQTEHVFHNGTVRFTIKGIGLPPPIPGQDRVLGFMRPGGQNPQHEKQPLMIDDGQPRIINQDTDQ